MLNFNRTAPDSVVGLTPKVDTFIELPEDIFKARDSLLQIRNEDIDNTNFGSLAEKRASSPDVLRKKGKTPKD